MVLPRNKIAKNKKSETKKMTKKQLINGTVSKAAIMYDETKEFVENFLAQPGMVDIRKTNVWRYIQWENDPDNKGLKIEPKFPPIVNNQRLKEYWKWFEGIFERVRSGQISEAQVNKMQGYQSRSVEEEHHYVCLMAGIDWKEGRFSGRTSDYSEI